MRKLFLSFIAVLTLVSFAPLVTQANPNNLSPVADEGDSSTAKPNLKIRFQSEYSDRKHITPKGYKIRKKENSSNLWELQIHPDGKTSLVNCTTKKGVLNTRYVVFQPVPNSTGRVRIRMEDMNGKCVSRDKDGKLKSFRYTDKQIRIFDGVPTILTPMKWVAYGQIYALSLLPGCNAKIDIMAPHLQIFIPRFPNLELMIEPLVLNLTLENLPDPTDETETFGSGRPNRSSTNQSEEIKDTFQIQRHLKCSFEPGAELSTLLSKVKIMKGLQRWNVPFSATLSTDVREFAGLEKDPDNDLRTDSKFKRYFLKEGNAYAWSHPLDPVTVDLPKTLNVAPGKVGFVSVEYEELATANPMPVELSLSMAIKQDGVTLSGETLKHYFTLYGCALPQDAVIGSDGIDFPITAYVDFKGAIASEPAWEDRPAP